MDDWTSYVSTRSLARGCDYFESGCVHAVERHADGWHVTVSGGSEYAVFIPASMSPLDAWCTCPHYADGNICKHIAAAFIAVERQLNMEEEDKRSGTEGESIEDIVLRADADDLRAFIVEAARYDEVLKRELRATFGVADVEQTKRELQKVTTTLIRRYERGGFIDWNKAMEFGYEYTTSIESIMRPFYSSKDASALIDLAVTRLVQLQRIRIDDSDGFFSDALNDVLAHLDRAFTLGDSGEHRRLFETLSAFMEENPGEDRGDIYWFEQEAAEVFLVDRLLQDAEFAPYMMTLADERLAALPSVPEGERSLYEYERAHWAEIRLKAMASLGDTPNVLHAYAESNGLLRSADTIRLIADAYVAADLPHEAMAFLREHLDAQEPFRSFRVGDEPPRIADRLAEIADEFGAREELVDLYQTLLLMEPSRSTHSDDLTHWYDELHRLVGDAKWDDMRERLLEEAPDTTANTCLAHEGSLEELYDRIMAKGSADLMRFERILSGAHPEPYIEHYIKDATSLVKRARDRGAYRSVAAELAHAAGLPGGRNRAQEAALAIRAEYPRRRALIDELRSAGFAV